MAESAANDYIALIQVTDLARIRAFYSKSLNLGAPIVDSNFWVEFEIPGSGTLILEHTKATHAGEGVRRGISWLMRTDDLAAKIKDLETHGVRPLRPPFGVPGKECATFADPEGNLFTLYMDAKGK